VIVFALSTGNKLVVGLVALVWILGALVVAMVIPRSRPDFPGKHLPAFLGLAVVFFAAMLVAVFGFAKESKESELGLHGTSSPETPALTQTGVTSTSSAAPTTSSGATVDLAAGKKVWDKASCGGCHVLAAAKGTGHVGPDLDTLKPDEATVAHQVENGGGAMPAFKGILSADEIQTVAAYVAQVAGKS
jgi:mono/diheme cytochrome c family protein